MNKFQQSFSLQVLVLILLLCLNSEAYMVGVGRADCTGPSAEIVFVSLPNFNYG